MSGMLIPNMEKASCCYYCTLSHVDNDYGEFAFCPLLSRGIDKGQKAPDCPLVELPPHGKLKDTDVIINTIKKATEDAFGKWDTLRYGYLSDVIDMIEKAPAILEASKE